MLRLPFCAVEFEDDILAAVDTDGLVVASGESPNATVRIAVADRNARKYRTVDRLTGASFSRKGQVWTFSGRSEHLANLVGADDATMSVTVTPAPGCADCDR
jgi:hypothetical protein